MNPTTRARDVVGGFALALVAVGLAIYLRLAIPVDLAARTFTLVLYFLALLAVIKATFAWGELRGFPVRRENRRLHFPNLVRNLVMAAMVVPIFVIFSSPVVMLAVALAR